jgi:hypothetical protein
MMQRTMFALTAMFIAAVPAGAGEISLRSLLDDMTNLSAMAEFPDPPYVARQFSSYDRASTSPANKETWFANNDCGNYLRIEDRGGRKEHVMADMQGPGAIVRIWSPNPGGTLRIYIDGAATPALEAPMADLLAGKHAFLPPPIAVGLSQGWNLYLPMPYRKSCKVTCDQGGQYYHVNYRTYPAGAAVTSFTYQQLEAAGAGLARLARRLDRPSTAGPSFAGLASTPFDAAIGPGETVVLAKKSGPGAIARIDARVDVPKERMEAALRAVVVRMTFDGQRTVEAPLGDFFGAAPGINPFASLPLGVAKNGSMYCHWLMPFERTAEITLSNLGKSSVAVKGGVGVAAWKWTGASMHFHARWKAEFGVRTRPMQDWNYLTATGKGVFGGVAFFIDNPVKDWWGEGDEKIYVDGETFPSHFGTGTEDYYGSGWCCPRLFTHAYHNQPRCDGPGNYGRTSVNRFHILDRIPFTKSFKFDMELWHWKDCKVNVAVLACYYGLPGAADTFPPITPGQLVLRPLPEIQVFKVAGAIEGEQMKVLRKTGQVEPQECDGDSGGWHLWWRGGQQPGDELLLGFDVAKAGKYRVSGRFLKAIDYGIVQLAVNGEKPAKTLDFYHDGVVLTEEIPLGTFELRQGQNRLSAVVVGANEKAQKAYMFGLDYLKLQPAP